MNFVLTLFICSYTAGQCLPPYQWPETFVDGYSCMVAGNNASNEKLIEIGAAEVNSHKIYIKFQCLEVQSGDPA